VVVGKPAPTMFEQTAAAHGALRPLVIGDRLDTDIEAANRAGMDSLLVLTGVTRPADLLRAPPLRRPTYVAADLDGLFTVDDAVPVSKATGGWHVERDNGALVLSGSGKPLDALRTLCAVAWQSDDAAVTTVRAHGTAADAASKDLALAT
jgi:glycerol 3-phosphatase-2